MKVAQRIGREYAAQMVSFAVNLADRLLIAGFLLRYWGLEDFAGWSIAMAAAGMVSLLDFGVNLYSTNRILFLVQQGKVAEVRIAQRSGNLLIGATSLAGFAAVVLGFGLFAGRIDGVETSASLWLAAALLAAATALRSAVGAQQSLYRAHEQYTRQTLVIAALDTVRILVTVIAVVAGGGIIAVAVAQLAVTVLFALYVTLIDTPRRFPEYRFALGAMPKPERAEALRISLGYWVQGAPNILLTYLPVFLLTGLGAAAVAIAQFVLMRTIGNFVRQVLQMFAIVLGQEAALRLARDDQAGLAQVYRESALLLTAQTACAAGGLLALAPQLFALWTGEPQLYDALLLWLALAPPVLLPTMTLAMNMLATANLPFALAAGRVAQVVITIGAFYALPIGDVATRMLAALALGELIGFALPVAWATHRIVPRAGVVFHLEIGLRSLICALLVYAAIVGAVRVLGLDGYGALATGLVVGAVAAVAVTIAVGLTGSRRAGLANVLRRRLAKDRSAA